MAVAGSVLGVLFGGLPPAGNGRSMFENDLSNNYYHGNPKPSFLGVITVITHILGV